MSNKLIIYYNKKSFYRQGKNCEKTSGLLFYYPFSILYIPIFLFQD